MAGGGGVRGHVRDRDEEDREEHVTGGGRWEKVIGREEMHRGKKEEEVEM